MKTNNYITHFEITGYSEVDVDKICNDWNDNFSIEAWNDEDELKYTLLILNKKQNKYICKTMISRSQADNIIENLKLILVKSTIFASAGTFITSDCILKKIEKFKNKQRDCEQQLSIIQAEINNFIYSLNKKNK